MKEHRHPHPHRDPRQPRADARPGTNPPVFAWLPVDSASGYRLQVARDPGFEDICLEQPHLQDPLFLPETAFAPGRYFWRWSAGDGAMSEVFAFEVSTHAAVVEVPPAGEWLKRFPALHPRIYVRPEEVPALRAASLGERASAWQGLREQAEAVLAEPHEIEEPPFLPDRRESYRAFFEVWSPVMWNSRRFVKGAETLALAYLVGREDRFARAACRRMASISRWDPEGSSHLGHNDEAHMSVIWHGSIACDWVWDRFTDEEREAVLAQFRRRGQITFDHMHNRGSYGITRFDSHAGREIVFLALIALVFHDHLPEAETWLEWLRPVLCGIWPIWAGDDGAWAEGPSYGLAYVTIMTMFATALKRGAGVDLYKRPFWKNHARWRRYCLPTYAEWMGFGDHTERWANSWRSNADLVDLIGRETETAEFAPYVEALRAEAEHLHTPPKRQTSGVLSQLFLAPAAKTQVGEIPPRLRARIPLPHPPEGTAHGMLQVFPYAGWAGVRTDLDDPARDVAMIFRSSPLGAISHSHANNNDFILHAGGKVLAMPSGYYDGYGSDHHTHWVWHTKSHNCVTLSDASQIMLSHDSTGRIENAFEGEGLLYFRGNADASYSDRAQRCRRHVFFLKAQGCFVMIDEFAAAPGIDSALQWNIHSWNRFAVDEGARTFLLERDGSSLEGHFMYHNNAFFSLSEGWDPPPMRAGKDDSQWHPQYHLRFTPSGLVNGRNLGVVLCPGHGLLDRAEVRTERSGETEVAHIGDDLVLVGGRDGVAYGNHRSDGLALLVVQGRGYELGEAGVVS